MDQEKEPTTEVSVRKRSGWPKGKKRGPRKPKAVVLTRTTETYTGEAGTAVTIPIEAAPARYSPDAVPSKRQPTVMALEPAHERELTKRKRVRKTGVMIDGRWFPCQIAILDRGVFFLEDGPIETRVPADGVKKIEFVGVSLTTALREPESPQVWDSGGQRRIVDPMDHVNVDPDPDREAFSRRFARDRNRELEELQGEIIGGES